MTTDKNAEARTQHDSSASELSGMVMLPRALTDENGAKDIMLGEFVEYEMIECPECLEYGPDDECEMCYGNHKVRLDVPVSWTTVEAIYAKIVEHYAK